MLDKLFSKDNRDKKEERIRLKREQLAAKASAPETDGDSVDTAKIDYDKSAPINSKRSKEKKRKRNKNTKGTGIGKLRLIIIGVIVFIMLMCGIRLHSYISSISRTHLSDKGFKHNARYDKCIKVKGIDVSEFQNEIKWKKVKSSEADFVFIRAGYRKSDSGELCEDANFKKNIKAANKSGIMVGAYIYSQALNADEAEEEADYLVDLVKRYDIDLPLVIDYEIYPGGRLEQAINDEKLYAASQFNEITTVFCRRIEAAGYESAIYGNYDMFTHYMDASLIDDKYTLWAAQYGGWCQLNADYMFWQATDSATIGGIEGNVDMDFWYVEPGKEYKTMAKGKKTQASIGKCEIKFDEDIYKLKNHRAVPKVEVEYSGKTLKEGRDYTLSFINNTEKGTGYAIVRGIRKYKNWIAVPFKIN